MKTLSIRCFYLYFFPVLYFGDILISWLDYLVSFNPLIVPFEKEIVM